MCVQTYLHDSLNGRSIWYTLSGQVEKEEYFLHGRNVNIERIYYDTTQANRWEDPPQGAVIASRNHLEIERLYTADGTQLIQREYTPEGVLRNEELYDPISQITTYIFYHPNGLLSSIEYKKDNSSFGRYQEYDEQGVPTRGRD